MEMRLKSLQESPSAFSTTYQSAIERTAESWREQADRSAKGTDRCTFFAFTGSSPVGIAAVYINASKKDEGEIVQVWVPRNSGAPESPAT